jgi:hypothetical protein
MNIDLIQNSLEYYDVNREKYQKFVDKIKYIKFKTSSSESNHNTLKFYDENKIELFDSAYEIIGAYMTDSKIWTWAWSIPTASNGQTYIISKIFNYARQLPKKELFLKTELLTSKFQISTRVQLDIHASIASYLSRQPFILSYIFEANDYDTEKNDLFPPYKQLKDMEDINKLPPNSIVHFLFILDPLDLTNL